MIEVGFENVVELVYTKGLLTFSGLGNALRVLAIGRMSREYHKQFAPVVQVRILPFSLSGE